MIKRFLSLFFAASLLANPSFGQVSCLDANLPVTPLSYSNLFAHEAVIFPLGSPRRRMEKDADAPAQFRRMIYEVSGFTRFPGRGPGAASIFELPEKYLKAARVAIDVGDKKKATREIKKALAVMRDLEEDLSEESPLGREYVERIKKLSFTAMSLQFQLHAPASYEGSMTDQIEGQSAVAHVIAALAVATGHEPITIAAEIAETGLTPEHPELQELFGQILEWPWWRQEEYEGLLETYRHGKSKESIARMLENLSPTLNRMPQDSAAQSLHEVTAEEGPFYAQVIAAMLLYEHRLAEGFLNAHLRYLPYFPDKARANDATMIAIFAARLARDIGLSEFEFTMPLHNVLTRYLAARDLWPYSLPETVHRPRLRSTVRLEGPEQAQEVQRLSQSLGHAQSLASSLDPSDHAQYFLFLISELLSPRLLHMTEELQNKLRELLASKEKDETSGTEVRKAMEAYERRIRENDLTRQYHQAVDAIELFLTHSIDYFADTELFYRARAGLYAGQPDWQDLHELLYQQLQMDTETIDDLELKASVSARFLAQHHAEQWSTLDEVWGWVRSNFQHFNHESERLGVDVQHGSKKDVQNDFSHLIHTARLLRISYMGLAKSFHVEFPESANTSPLRRSGQISEKRHWPMGENGFLRNNRRNDGLGQSLVEGWIPLPGETRSGRSRRGPGIPMGRGHEDSLRPHHKSVAMGSPLHSPVPFTIRSLSPSDYDTVARSARVLGGESETAGDKIGANVFYLLATFLNHDAAQIEKAWVAESPTGTLLGLYILRKDAYIAHALGFSGRDRAVQLDVAVDRHHRQHGLIRELSAEGIEYCRQEGIRFRLHFIDSKNIPSFRAWYKLAQGRLYYLGTVMDLSTEGEIVWQDVFMVDVLSDNVELSGLPPPLIRSRPDIEQIMAEKRDANRFRTFPDFLKHLEEMRRPEVQKEKTNSHSSNLDRAA